MELMNRQAGVVNFEPMKPVSGGSWMMALRLTWDARSSLASIWERSPGAAIMECAMHRNNENYFWNARGVESKSAASQH
eukprot:750435-Hanusia_phi.AAC.2